MTLNTALGPAPLPRQGCQVDSIGRRLGALSARYPDDPEYPRKDRPYERIPSFGMIPSLRVCLLSKGREPDAKPGEEGGDGILVPIGAGDGEDSLSA